MYTDNRNYAKAGAVKLCNDILASQDVHFFCKDIIRTGLKKDCVDAVKDLELALRVLKQIAE